MIEEGEREKRQALINHACELSTFSVNNGGGPFGCVITDSKYNILSEEHNQVTFLNDPTAHAEIMAIRKACEKLNTFDLSNCLLFTSCEPCPMCLSAIYWSRIETVCYSNTRNDAKNIGFDDEFIYDEITKKNEERKIKLTKINSPISFNSFNIWSNKKNKKLY